MKPKLLIIFAWFWRHSSLDSKNYYVAIWVERQVWFGVTVQISLVWEFTELCLQNRAKIFQNYFRHEKYFENMSYFAAVKIYVIFWKWWSRKSVKAGILFNISIFEVSPQDTLLKDRQRRLVSIQPMRVQIAGVPCTVIISLSE